LARSSIALASTRKFVVVCTASLQGMKTVAPLLFAMALPSVALAQQTEPSRNLDGAFYVGLNLGELPWGGSFKPGLEVGYHFNDLVYVGATYQIADDIRRDGSSFNASGIGLGDPVDSHESVGGRFLIHTRLRPHRHSPFLSVGLVGNGEDTETSSYADGTTVVQTRPRGVRPSLGLGYDFTFDNGLALNVLWSGWVFDIPSPTVQIRGGSRTKDEEEALRQKVNDNFRDSITNAYHVFALGAGYTF